MTDNLTVAIENLSLVTRKLNERFFRDLKRLRSPSGKLRNLVLVFLTLFHEELDELVEGIDDEEVYENDQ